MLAQEKGLTLSVCLAHVGASPVHPGLKDLAQRLQEGLCFFGEQRTSRLEIRRCGGRSLLPLQDVWHFDVHVLENFSADAGRVSAANARYDYVAARPICCGETVYVAGLRLSERRSLGLLPILQLATPSSASPSHLLLLQRVGNSAG